LISFFSKAKKWQEEFEKLRMIIHDCGLTEELNCGASCQRQFYNAATTPGHETLESIK